MECVGRQLIRFNLWFSTVRLACCKTVCHIYISPGRWFYSVVYMTPISETTFQGGIDWQVGWWCLSSSLYCSIPFRLPPLLLLIRHRVINLFSTEHIHRQNCLEDYGVKVAVQKLEKIDNSRLQDMWVVIVCVDCARSSTDVLCVLVWDTNISQRSCMKPTFELWQCVYCVFLYETHCWLSVAVVLLFSHTQSEGHAGPFFISERIVLATSSLYLTSFW